MIKNNHRGIKNRFLRIFKAAAYSTAGIKAAWRNEAAFRDECIAAAILLPIGYFYSDSIRQFAILVIPILLVLVIELLNTGIESIIDLVSPEQNELAGIAKDTGSAAVMISILIAVITWLVVLF